MSLKYRPATLEDSDLLLTWRNDALEGCGSTELVGEREHRHFMLRMTAGDPWCQLYVFELNDIPVGQGRIERRYLEHLPLERACNISYSVDRFYRGMGVGKELVAQLVAKAREEHTTVAARIKRGNIGSAICALAAGVNCIEVI